MGFLHAIKAILLLVLIAGVAYAVVLVGWLIAIAASVGLIIWVAVDHAKFKRANKNKAP